MYRLRHFTLGLDREHVAAVLPAECDVFDGAFNGPTAVVFNPAQFRQLHDPVVFFQGKALRIADAGFVSAGFLEYGKAFMGLVFVEDLFQNWMTRPFPDTRVEAVAPAGVVNSSPAVCSRQNDWRPEPGSNAPDA